MKDALNPDDSPTQNEINVENTTNGCPPFDSIDTSNPMCKTDIGAYHYELYITGALAKPTCAYFVIQKNGQTTIEYYFEPVGEVLMSHWH